MPNSCCQGIPTKDCDAIGAELAGVGTQDAWFQRAAAARAQIARVNIYWRKVVVRHPPDIEQDGVRLGEVAGAGPAPDPEAWHQRLGDDKAPPGQSRPGLHRISWLSSQGFPVAASAAAPYLAVLITARMESRAGEPEEAHMGIRRRSAVIFALAAVGVVAVASLAIAAPTSTFTFSFAPSNVPAATYQNGALSTDLKTTYTNPGNNNPGGAVERTQIYLEKNWKINPAATPKCSSSQLSGKTMAQAMAACKAALVGTGTATATANGLFTINGCVLLFNGQPQSGLPTLKVFTRVQASNPSTISCASPATNNQGNATVLLNGVLKNATAPYGKVLDVDHITQAASFPLTEFKTKVQKGSFIAAKCPASPWHMKVTWTYNNATTKTVSKTQPCT
jgi:hypothetical protein